MYGIRVSLFLFCSAVFAQSDRGAITGVVLDPSAAGVPNAKVTATNTATAVRYPAATTAAGHYTIPQLPVGRYEVAVEAAGFRRHVRREIEVNVAQTVTLNVTLEVGQVEQAVEGTADPGRVESSTSDLGTLVSRERVMDLPLAVSGNMRNPEAFIFLTPGVTGDTGNTQINGSQSRAKEVLLDGIGSTSPESGGLLFTYPSVESIAEFKLVSANFSAEFGRTGGGFEIFTTRSGSNDLHGSLFEYFRNDVFDARGFFAPVRQVNRQNEFGGAVGGPIVVPGVYNGKNKSFFHVVYNGFRFRAGSSNQFVSIAPAPFRSGDFARLTRQLYDPRTTSSDAAGFTRTPFPGNQIPANRFSAVSAKILPVIPQPTNDGLLNNFLSVGARSFDRDQVTVKLDHAFSDRSRLSGFVYFNEQESKAAEVLPSPLTASLREQRPGRWARLAHDWVISPSTLNHLAFGFTREPQYWQKLHADEGWPTRIGLTGVNSGPSNVFPRVTFTDGYMTWADDAKNVGAQVNNAFQVSDSVSHVRGSHSLKFGGEARWLQTNGADPFNQQGLFSFSSFETALPTAAGRSSSGNAFASFLLGTVDSASYNGLFVVPGNRYRYLSLFFQDDWKVTRRLTLNIGLRYEIYFPRTERFNNFSGFDMALPNPGAGNRPGAIRFLGDGPGRDNARSSFADTDSKDFGPRLGFAFALTEKTVLRGGYGVYYAPGNATSGLRASQRFAIGFNAQPSYASTDTGVTPAFNWDQGFPTNWPRPPFIDPTVGNGTSVDMILAGDGRPPYFQNWTFGIQRELPARILADASYVGNKGTRLGNGLMSWNQVDPVNLALGATLSRPITSAEAAAAGIRVPYAGFNGTVSQALRPFPQVLNITNNSNPNGNSTYHALQVKAEKRFSGGLTFLTAYTWAKTISDGDIQAGGGPAGQTFYNRGLEKSVSTNDVPHVFALSYLYELPFGRGKRYGGWVVTGIHLYSAGKPIALSATNGLPLFNGVLRPDVVDGVARRGQYTDFDPALHTAINPAAFRVPGALRFGTAGRAYADARGFAPLDESFGVIKRTPLVERVTLVFRAEFFNAFNRVVFAAPAANISNTNFGRVSAQANSPRQGQLALRLEF